MALDLKKLPEKLLAALRAPLYAMLTTLHPDGSPHVVCVCMTFEVNHRTARVIALRSSVKVANLRTNKSVSLSMQDGEGRWATFEGDGCIRENRASVEEAVRQHRLRYDRKTSFSPDFVAIEIQVKRIIGEWWVNR